MDAAQPGQPMPREAGLAPGALGAVARQSLWANLFALVCTATAAMAMARRVSPRTDVLLAAGVVSAAAALGLFLDLRRKRRTWEQFRLKLEPDALSTTAPGRRARTLSRAEVRNIVEAEWPAPGLVVRGVRRRAPVFVPAALEGYAQVREQLAAWRPIERSHLPPGLGKAWPFIIPGAAILEALAIGARHPSVAGGAATVLLVVFLWSLFMVLRSHRVSLRGKLFSLFLLAPAGWLVLRLWEIVR